MRLFMARLSPARSPYVSTLLISAELHSTWALRDHNLIFRVRMISLEDMDLGLMSTRSCKHVPFSCKSRTSQYMKAVTIKVERSIVIIPL